MCVSVWLVGVVLSGTLVLYMYKRGRLTDAPSSPTHPPTRPLTYLLTYLLTTIPTTNATHTHFTGEWLTPQVQNLVARQSSDSPYLFYCINPDNDWEYYTNTGV